MVTNDDYIKWGNKVFEDAKKIYELQREHLALIHDIVNKIESTYNLPDINIYELSLIGFRSHTYTNSTSGPKELLDYWLNYLNPKFPWFDKNKPYEIGAKEILDNVFDNYILKEFNINSHFSGGKFLIDRWQFHKFDLSINVPYTLDYISVVFGIFMLEKLTNLKVNKISLWYYSHELTMTEMSSQIVIGLDDLDAKQKYSGSSSISKQLFFGLNPSSCKYWYRDVPTWENYIKDIDIKTIQCSVCRERIFSSNEKWYCKECSHFVDKYGNCIDINCNSCENKFFPF
jgi:hypothetical protein